METSPDRIRELDGPLLALTFDYYSLTASVIAWVQAHRRPWRKTGRYSHAFWIDRPGVIVETVLGSRLGEAPIKKYLTGNHRLKVWGGDWTVAQIESMRRRIQQDAGKKIKYDWLAGLGILLGAPWIQNPWKDNCSEWSAEILALGGAGAAGVLGKHPTPGAIDAYCKARPTRFTVVALYDPNEGQ